MQINDYIMPIVKTRYLQPGETPEGMLRRVASFLASGEKDEGLWAARFYDIMDSAEFSPSSPVLMNAGTAYPMLSACFVLNVPDDMHGIFMTLHDMAVVQQRGGGTGFNFSHIREEGSLVRSTGGTASGVLSFLEVFNAATNIVKQGGKRRGANIALLSIDHPEIIDFINVKRQPNKLNNFNLSVAISDKFIKAVENDENWELISRVNGNVVKVIPAVELMNMIGKAAYDNGEPGVIFMDVVERNNPTPQFGPLDGVNPCGEVSLYDHEACNLGSVNLEKFIDFKSNSLTRERLRDVVQYSVRMLDNVVDKSVYPVEEITQKVRRTRKIGLGISGLHSYLLMNGLAYDSYEGRQAASDIVSFLSQVANDYSYTLAEEKSPYIESEKSLPRNAARTCIAPTGTISMIMDTSSSGVEPVFSYTYTRKIAGEDYHVEVPILKPLLRKYGVEPTDELIRQIENEGGSLIKIPSIPDELKKIAANASEISVDGHLRMQADLQRFIDNNISKTIAMPHDFPDDNGASVSKLILDSYHMGVRGLTVYRDGSRDGQVITSQKVQPNVENVIKVENVTKVEDTCPICGSALIREEGCIHCTNCGWSTCTT